MSSPKSSTIVIPISNVVLLANLLSAFHERDMTCHVDTTEKDFHITVTSPRAT